MIDLSHKYALLNDGTIEPLFYSWGEPRMAYQDKDGKFYLDHDVWSDFMGMRVQAFKHSEIFETSNFESELSDKAETIFGIETLFDMEEGDDDV